MYYKPTCRWCKDMMPDFELLAEEFKEHEDLVIARFDAPENEAINSYPTNTFPTIVYYN